MSKKISTSEALNVIKDALLEKSDHQIVTEKLMDVIYYLRANYEAEGIDRAPTWHGLKCATRTAIEELEDYITNNA